MLREEKYHKKLKLLNKSIDGLQCFDNIYALEWFHQAN